MIVSGTGDRSEREKLREDLAEAREEIRVLREVSSEINATLDLDRIYAIVLRTMDELFGFRHAQILLLEENGRSLRVVASRGYEEGVEGARVAVGTGVVGQVAARRRILRVGSLSRQRSYARAVRSEVERSNLAGELDAEPRLPGLPDVETQIGIPLLIKDTLVGVFAVESAERVRFTEREETLASIVGNLAASAIHNALLYAELERQRADLARANVTLAGRVEERTRELERASQELSVVKALHGARVFTLEDMVGESRAMKAARRLLKKVAASPGSTVLVTGENGTGKDLAAKVIHCTSARAAAPFVNITCSALPEPLLESELFGHERGAFTDARQQKKGLLELADGGSVFLDEIGEMSLVLQAKLLRFLEERAFRRVGGTRDLRVDVRVIAATNRDLERAVKDGTFRQDLYYRLQVLPVALPPLRERAGDIPALARMFVEQYRAEFKKPITGITPEALRLLESHGWPGNVRELKNAIERAVLLAEGTELEAEDFEGLAGATSREDLFRLPPGGLDFNAVERDLVVQALRLAGGNKARAAALLGMDRDWIRYRIQRHGVAEDRE